MIKRMMRIMSTMVFIISLFVFSPPFSSAQDELVEIFDILQQSPKLNDAKLILNDFFEGKSTTKVMVGLQKPARALRMQNNLRDMEVRKQLELSARAAQNSVISTLDPIEVRITNTYYYIYGFAAEVTVNGLQELVDNPDVVFIEKDKAAYLNLAQGIPLMNAYNARATYSGSGLAIAICDTGIDYTHPMLGGGGFPNSKVIGGYDTGDNDNDPMDDQGHGTACAGIAAGNLGAVGDYIGGVAYGAKLYALKVEQSNGNISTSDIIEAWDWCVNHQYDDPNNPILIISTSIGGGMYNSVCDNAESSYASAAAIAVAAGMTLFASSGNDGYCSSIKSPACISHVISVGAVYDANMSTTYPCVSDSSCDPRKIYTESRCLHIDPPSHYYLEETKVPDKVIFYSNTASFLGLLAPSACAYTTDVTGSGGLSSGDYEPCFNGTSAACPYAAGAAACLQSAAKSITGAYLSPSQVKSKLVDTGDLITDGKVSITKPRVDLKAAVNSLNGGSTTTIYVDPSGSCGGNTPCYTTIQTAVNAASTGTSIKILQGNYSENVVLSTSKEVTLSGGWNSSHTSQSSTTSVNSLTINNGSITVDNLVLETGSAEMPPTVTTGSATSVSSTSATLNGTVNPNGASTTYYFQYGTSTSYRSSTTSTSAESGTSDVSVDASISGLSSNTTYHYRLVATNSAGTNYGSDGTFSTSASPITVPSVTTSSATSVSTSSATLNGTVNPNGASTTYYFQYGTTTSYGSTTSGTSAGSGSSSVSASASLTGLSSSTTYHFRLVATNSAGTSYGDDQSFTAAISPEQTANVVFYNSLVCAGSSFTADLMIDGQTLTSTTSVYSNCQEFDCGVKLPWTLIATTPSCGTIVIAGSIVFDCNCLYKFELDLYEGSSYVYIYETCPGDCSDVSSASIGSTKLLDSVLLTKGADLLGLTVLDPLMSK
jgi:subtilisin family serine protease